MLLSLLIVSSYFISNSCHIYFINISPIIHYHICSPTEIEFQSNVGDDSDERTSRSLSSIISFAEVDLSPLSRRSLRPASACAFIQKDPSHISNCSKNPTSDSTQKDLSPMIASARSPSKPSNSGHFSYPGYDSPRHGVTHWSTMSPSALNENYNDVPPDLSSGRNPKKH